MSATDDAVAAHSGNAPAKGRGVCLGRVIVNVIAVKGRADLRRFAASVPIAASRRRAFPSQTLPSEPVCVIDVSLRFQRDSHEAGSLSRQ
jgi:hypothetical protein